MNAVGTLALVGWIPVILLLFALLPPRKAVIAAFVVGWLFLPMGSLQKIEGLPDFNKFSATSVGVLLGALIFDARRFLTWRPRLADLPMLVWCVCPMASSVSNNLGVYDGCSAIFQQVITWGLPYGLGRLYFTDPLDLRELAKGIVIGGLVYVPLCLFENRLSPELHYWLYGFHQTISFRRIEGFGFLGYQPRVFVQNALALTLFMGNCALIALWMWLSGWPRRIWQLPLGLWTCVLFVVTILCKSLGAVLLTMGGAGVLLAGRWLRWRLPLYCLIAVTPLYVALRASGNWSGKQLLDAAKAIVTEERAASLQTRLDNEDILVAKALQRPVFGWGGWARARVYDEFGKDISTTDGLWVIAIGNTGIVGLCSLLAAFLIPVLLLAKGKSGRFLVQSMQTPILVFVIAVLLHTIDCLFNAMLNPIYILGLGGLASLSGAGAQRYLSNRENRAASRAGTRTAVRQA